MTKKTTIVHLDSAPLVLRVEEMVDGEVGKVAKLKGEIPLKRGRNEVDAEDFKVWLEMNKDGPLVKNRNIKTEEPKDDKDDQAEKQS